MSDWVCAKCGTLVGEKFVQRGIDNKPVGLCYVCRGNKPDPRSGSKEAQEAYAAQSALRPIVARLQPVVTREEYDRLKAERDRQRGQRKEVAPELSPWAELVPDESKASRQR